jgi:protein-L-isoaspartate(D-aspartate) O-methyltransferase
MHDFAAYRRNMIESQIRTNQVTDAAVLEAFSTVPRELFVPANLAACAYVDEAVPLGNGRFLVEPMVTSRLVQALDVKPHDKVLVVGAATGYMAAILSRLAAHVFALEADPTLAGQATQNLRTLGASNVTVVQDALERGHARKGPYDAMMCDGAVTTIPAALSDQLIEGGRLATVFASADGTSGQGVLILKSHGTLSRRVLFDAVTPFLPGFAAEPAFVF